MRVNNSIRNVITALIGQGLGIILSFIGRGVFINTLGMEYLGINGLFTNVLSILSLAEMGVGTAIIYSLYSPLAHGDKRQVRALMTFYEQVYRTIGVTIFILGIALVPFLKYIIKGQPDIPYLYLIYLLFLINTVVSYFFAYKRSLIIADQKNYIATMYRYGFYIVLNVCQIILLLTTKSFIGFLIVQISVTILENLMIANKANKMYPFLRDKTKIKLGIESRKEITKNVKALLCHKIGWIVVSGTDNIIISSFLGVYWVGLYSNYYLVTNALNIVIGQIFNALTASVGNLNALESKEKTYNVYKKILFANFWIVGFSSVCLISLFNLFIGVWLGEEYIFESNVVLVIVINFYISMVRKATLVYKDAMGLFWYDRYKPLFEAGINMVISIILVPKLGIIGVFIGTLISTITTAFWIEPYVLYRYGFKIKIRKYFQEYFKYTTVVLIMAIITYQLCNIFKSITLGNLIIRAFICLTIPNIIFMTCFYRTDEFKYFMKILIKVITNIFNRGMSKFNFK